MSGQRDTLVRWLMAARHLDRLPAGTTAMVSREILARLASPRYPGMLTPPRWEIPP